MPRPCKPRRICHEPVCTFFVPGDRTDTRLPLTLTVDELETIRLIDLEGLSQEQCADRMGVARTTAQAIYGAARARIASFLIHGRSLVISGGDYALCRDDACGVCCHSPINNKGERIMKIAATYENGEIFQHFGHTEQFKIYDVAEGKVVSSSIVSTNGSGHGALAALLSAQGVDTLICGGIGGGAQQALAMAGIRLVGGVQGDADKAVEALLANTLTFSDQPNCDHHDHEHGSCGEHGCGEHGCGEHGCGNH